MIEAVYWRGSDSVLEPEYLGFEPKGHNSCVTLIKFPNILVPWFLHLQTGDKRSTE